MYRGSCISFYQKNAGIRLGFQYSIDVLFYNPYGSDRPGSEKGLFCWCVQ